MVTTQLLLMQNASNEMSRTYFFKLQIFFHALRLCKRDTDSPLSTPEESLDDLVVCVAEIAEVTRGFTIKE